LVDAHGMRERPGVEVLAALAEEHAVAVEFQNLRGSIAVGRAAAGAAACIDVDVPLGVDGDAGNLAEMHIRRKLQQVRDRIVGNFGRRLLGQCRRAQQYEQPDKPAFHGDLPLEPRLGGACVLALDRVWARAASSIQISALATQSAPALDDSRRLKTCVTSMRSIISFPSASMN